MIKKAVIRKLVLGLIFMIMMITVMPELGIQVYAGTTEDTQPYYVEDFTYPDEVANTTFLPADWVSAGSLPSVRAIRADEENYYYEIGRTGDTGSSYIGKIFEEDLPTQFSMSLDMKYTNSANVNLFMYENRLNAGNIAVRAGIKNDSNGGNLFVYEGGTQKTLVENIEALGWIHLSYIIDNDAKVFEIVLSSMAGEELYHSDTLAFYSSSAMKAGVFSMNCDVQASICVDNIRVDEKTTDTEESEPEYPIVDFYTEDFTYPDETENSAFLPSDWTKAGVAPSLMAIRQDGENYYYEIGRAGDIGSSYIGKTFTMTLPDQYVVSMDMKYANSATVNLPMYASGINSGNLAIRSGITKDSNGGALYAYDGSANKVLANNIENLGWVSLSYVIDNAARKYEVVLNDLNGSEIYHSEKLSFYSSEAGKAGALSINANPEASFFIDNIKISGEDKPYVPTPVEVLPEKTGTVSLTDTGTQYILSNDYTKMVLNKADAGVTSLIRYISGNSIYEDGGYDVLGGEGYGYYLMNYVLDGTRGACAIKNAVGEIVQQRDDYCEVVITLDDKSVSPVAFEFHFVLEDDTEGVYMYAYSRKATGVTGVVEIEQSRYAFRVDSRIYQYSAVADGELTAFPELEDYRDKVFDATYAMEDGSIYTKYINSSYQYNSFVCGAYGDGLGFSLITPSRDWAGGGYTKQDIDVHDGGTNTTRLVNWHFATAHYGTGTAKATDGWEKLYGPVLWYANAGETKEAIRQDAVEKTAEEIASWPYNWVDDEDYSATTRSTVTGSFSVKNGKIIESNTDISPEGTYGWAVLSDIRSESWQQDNNYYEYYAPIQADGSFNITGIRPGTYRININVNGIIGEYEQDSIVVGASSTVDLGKIVWDDPVYGKTLWTVGLADRTAEEYAGAVPYRNWGGHLMFDQLFPNGVNYKVGESDYTKDWYFVHMASQTAGLLEHYDGSFYFDEATGVVKYDASRATPITIDDERWKGDEATKWNILFDSDTTYSKGKATLVVAIAGSRGATLVVTVNGTPVTDVINIKSSGAMPRCALVDQYVTIPIEFDASLLKEGENVINLSHESPSYSEGETSLSEMSAYKSIIYDAIRLDVDAETEEPEIDTDVLVTAIQLNEENVTIKTDENLALQAMVEPSNATNKTLSWSSSNPSVVTVDGNGLVKALTEGTATVTATSTDGSNITVNCSFTVQPNIVNVQSVSMNKSSTVLGKGSSETLTVSVLPENATDTSVSWISSNSVVASVDSNGKITGNTYGTAVITVSSKDNPSLKADCQVSVGYQITYKLNKGTNNDNNPSAYYKQKVKLSAPTRKGYEFKGWYTDSKFKTKITFISKSSTKNYKLYAKWEKVTKPAAPSIKSVTNVKTNKMNVTLKSSVSNAKGYEITFATNKKFTKNKNTATISKASTLSKTISKVTKGSTYYVKVRAYKVDSSGNKIYSKYSKTISVKIKK